MDYLPKFEVLSRQMTHGELIETSEPSRSTDIKELKKTSTSGL